MATFNGERYLGEQLRSIDAQDLQVEEILVRDDGSQDGTAAIVASEARDLRTSIDFRVNHQPNGVAANFAGAMRECRSDLIALSDQDDVWEPAKTRQLSSLLAASGAWLVFSDAAIIDGNSNPTGQLLSQSYGFTPSEHASLRSGDLLGAFLQRNLVTGATAMIDRRLLEFALPIPPGWLHDEWLAITAAALGKVAWSPRPLTKYRIHGENVVGVPPGGLTGLVQRGLGQLGLTVSQRAARGLDLAAWSREHEASLVPGAMAMIARKAEYEVARAELPPSRFARLPGIAAQWRNGNYRRVGRGWRAVAQDIVRPDHRS